MERTSKKTALKPGLNPHTRNQPYRPVELKEPNFQKKIDDEFDYHQYIALARRENFDLFSTRASQSQEEPVLDDILAIMDGRKATQEELEKQANQAKAEEARREKQAKAEKARREKQAKAAEARREKERQKKENVQDKQAQTKSSIKFRKVNIESNHNLEDLNNLVDARVTGDSIPEYNSYKVAAHQQKLYISNSSKKINESFCDRLNEQRQSTHPTEDLNPLDTILRSLD